MERKIIRPTPKWKLVLGVLAAVVTLLVSTLIFAQIVTPSTEPRTQRWSAERLAESKKTLVYALQQIQAGGVARTGQAAAVTVIVMLVPIAIFIASQNQILETMASSGLKD